MRVLISVFMNGQEYQARVFASKVACADFMHDQGTPWLGGFPQYQKFIPTPNNNILIRQLLEEAYSDLTHDEPIKSDDFGILFSRGILSGKQ